MSVHSDSLEMTTNIDPRGEQESAPELEYRSVRNDSLSMFGAAIGGAILGMLLTLFVLAMINGGTLSFTGSERLDALEASVARINENVGAVSTNIDIVAQQAAVVQTQFDMLESTLASEMSSVNESLAVLDQTRNQFDTFVAALSTALDEINGAGEEQ